MSTRDEDGRDKVSKAPLRLHWRGSTCTLRFTLLTSLIILSILCGVGGCNLAPGREWEGLSWVTQAANIFIKNLEQASSSSARASNLSGIHGAFSSFTTLTILFFFYRTARQAVIASFYALISPP